MFYIKYAMYWHPNKPCFEGPFSSEIEAKEAGRLAMRDEEDIFEFFVLTEEEYENALPRIKN